MKRIVIPSLILLPLASGELSTDYAADRSLRIEIETEFSMETTDSVIEVNGEEREGRGGGSSEETRKIVMIDKVLEHADGAPTKVQRVFETIEADGMRLMGDSEREITRETPLNGLTLVITDEGAEVVDGTEPEDEKVLEGHRMTLALDALLPAESVEVDDHWKLDGEKVVRALGMDLDAAFFAPPQRPEGEGRRGGEGGGGRRRGGFGRGGGGSVAGMFTQGEWDAKATLVSLTEEHADGTCALVKLELSCTGSMPEPERGGRRDREEAVGAPSVTVPALENSFTIKLEGEFTFHVAERRPVSLSLEGTLSTERTMERSSERGDFYMYNAQQGKFEHTVTVSVVADEKDE